jgi:hypothetical protein
MCMWAPSSEADPTRGGAQPSSEVNLTREAVLIPRARRTPPGGREGLERGGPRPRERLSLERGEPHSRGVRCVALAGHGGHRGRGCAVCMFYVCKLICVLHFLPVLSGFPPGYLGDP